MKSLSKNKNKFLRSDYLILILVLEIAVMLYIWSMNYKSLQALLVTGTGIFYVLWGTIHHKREGDLHAKIIFEYILIALIFVIVLLTAIFRS